MEIPSIATRDLEFRYKNRPVLTQVDFTCGQGVFGLLGPNGAGKTTLIQILATATLPSAGAVRLLGADATRPAERDSIRGRLGYLPQHFGFYPDFTTAEFVEYFALLKGTPDTGVTVAVTEALRAVGLEDVRNSKLRTLSGGMLRRAGIAQAIVNKPAVLLLDEPTVGLDPQQRIIFRTLLRELGQRSAVLVSTHLVEDIAAACDRVDILHHGRIVFEGTPASLIERGTDTTPGDSPIERGYSAVLQAGDMLAW